MCQRRPSSALCALIVGGAGLVPGVAGAQVAATASFNFSNPLTYAGGVTETMPATGLGLHTSVYANQWGNAALPGKIEAAGTQLLRYPGGSYSDLDNWSTSTANTNAYVAAHSDFGNFIKVMDRSATAGMVTVNYGSDTTDTMGGQPQEAAAWVAYANGDPGLYGTSNDVSLGTDAAGVNWKTAGYWAKLRASTAAQYQSWATAAGLYNSANAFLAINHPTAENVKYWEIGNEIGGNGYFGPQWEYDLHAPYNNGNTSDNTGRKGNPLLSPTAYAQNLNAFATLMKQVDPTIKIGAGFNGKPNDATDKTILQTAGANIDFGIIHWYPTTALPGAVTTGTGAIPSLASSLRNSVNANTTKGLNGIEVDVTEFGFNQSGHAQVQNALFAADGYVTGFENGVKNMDFLEMSKPPYLGDGSSLTPGEVYYATQMLSHFAKTGGTFVSGTSSDSMLRVHAVRNADGSMALLLINDAAATDASQDRHVTVTLQNASAFAAGGTLYTFGDAQIDAATGAVSPPVQQAFALGNTVTITVPEQTIEVLDIPALPEPAGVVIAVVCGTPALLVRPKRVRR